MSKKTAAKFLEKRFGLTDKELRALADELRENEDAAADLKEQLILDEMLSRHLAFDRRDFCAQVRQRIRQTDSGTAFFRTVTDRIEEQDDRRRAVRGEMVGARVRRARPVRRGVWAAVAACLAIVVGAVVYNARREGEFIEVMVARIQETTPGVEIHHRGETVIAAAGMGLFAEDRVETGSDGRASVGYPGEDTRIDVAGNTALTIGSVKEGKRLTLDGGAIRATAAPQPKDRPMAVTTKHAEAEVVGTIFNLTAGSRSSILEVTEGLVRFTRRFDGKTIEVAAGFRAEAGEGIELVARPISEPMIAAAPAPFSPVEPKPVKYVDGPVLLEDDFEDPVETALSKWGMTVWTKGTKEGEMVRRVPTEEEVTRFLSVRSRQVPGGRSNAAHLDLDALGKGSPDLMSGTLYLNVDLRKLAENHPVSIEWDEWASPGSSRHYMLGNGHRRIKDVYRREGYKADPLVWNRGRIEIFPLKDTLGAGHYRIRRLGDGALIEECVDYYESFHVGITIRTGKTMIDNVVVKRMVPAGNGEM